MDHVLVNAATLIQTPLAEKSGERTDELPAFQIDQAIAPNNDHEIENANDRH